MPRRLARPTPWLLAAGALLAGPGAAHADPSGVDLKGKGALEVPGAAKEDSTGSALAMAGDFNADGREDLVVGAPFADPRGRKDAGVVYVLLGGAKLGGLDLKSRRSSRVIRIEGARRGDKIGSTVAGGGDVDGDGFADVVVGAPSADPPGRGNGGRAYVVRGGPSTRAVDLRSAGDRVITLSGSVREERAGERVGLLRDFNGDGRADVVVGAPNGSDPDPGLDDVTDGGGPAPARRQKNGRVSIVFGRPGLRSVDLGRLGADGVTLVGESAFALLGTSLGDAGDVTGDGRSELAVGATGVDAGGRQDAGALYVVAGRPEPGTLDVGTIAPQGGAAGYRVDGAVTNGQLGASTAGVGDVNGDGLPDLAIGVPRAPNGDRARAGAVVVAYGQRTAGVLDVATAFGPAPSAGYVLGGAQGGDGLGSSVGPAGDFDRDGRADVLAGAPGADSGCRGGSGSAYLVRGGLSGDLRSLNPGQGLRIDGAREGDALGAAVAGGGRLLGGSTPTIALGAYGARPARRAYAGSVFVVPQGIGTSPRAVVSYGRPFTATTPGGNAGDYGDYLSIPVRSEGVPVRGLTARVFSFGGESLGRGTLGTLPAGGSGSVDVKLRRRLTPGGYTVLLSWKADSKRLCGGRKAKLVVQLR